MSVDVVIKQKTRIVHANGEEESITNQFTGNLYEKDEQFFLRYQENAEQDLGNTWTTIRWNKKSPDDVTILRQGSIKMKQVFSKNREYLGQYHSPYGILEMKTTTHELDIATFTSTNGRIIIRYQLEINHQGVGEYLLVAEYSKSNTGG